MTVFEGPFLARQGNFLITPAVVAPESLAIAFLPVQRDTYECEECESDAVFLEILVSGEPLVVFRSKHVCAEHAREGS